MAELHVWAPQLRVVVLHRCVQAFNAVSGNSGTNGNVAYHHDVLWYGLGCHFFMGKNTCNSSRPAERYRLLAKGAII